ncbi:hypothetical protein ENUP19_0189G0006 [Entamoeba nuttalli]|uniref:Uncharacterized protein n=1 Tax=Entamoeba nuttalli TaxID=412467 RepID=A0ABQ0DN78_9EUKA
MFEVNNLTQQLLFLKDKSSKFENKNTHRKKRRRDDVTYNITDSSESQIVNELSPNVVVADEISSSEDQTDRKEEILTLYKCFALKLFERKLRCQLKGEIIERLIHEFEIKVNDINEYKEITKKTFKIKNENKREINRTMEEEIIKHQWKDKELKEIISKMNKKEEIEDDEVMKIFKEEMKEQEDVQFINYYYNKKKIHQIINIINKNEIIINTLDDYYHYIKSVASTINIINKNKQERNFLNINLYEILNENIINNRISIITQNELECDIKFTANWKAPGVDKIQGFWIKYLEQPKKYLLKLFNEWLNNHNEIPPHFIQGRTILIYKKGDKLDTQNYRQITYLNCLLKVYTSILKMKIESQLMLNQIEKQLSLNQI